ncbi:MAG TPA: hypothetical protein VN713_07815 [Sphingomicrobium sp.]|nr:hypothetical protein [Sphingomicrobium sp.]
MEQVNTQLTRGLKLCHSLIDDYRSKLSGGLNDIYDFHAANDDSAEEDDSRLG